MEIRFHPTGGTENPQSAVQLLCVRRCLATPQRSRTDQAPGCLHAPVIGPPVLNRFLDVLALQLFVERALDQFADFCI
jgi:hypothetical protein